MLPEQIFIQRTIRMLLILLFHISILVSSLRHFNTRCAYCIIIDNFTLSFLVSNSRIHFTHILLRIYFDDPLSINIKHIVKQFTLHVHANSYFGSLNFYKQSWGCFAVHALRNIDSFNVKTLLKFAVDKLFGRKFINIIGCGLVRKIKAGLRIWK